MLWSRCAEYLAPASSQYDCTRLSSNSRLCTSFSSSKLNFPVSYSTSASGRQSKTNPPVFEALSVRPANCRLLLLRYPNYRQHLARGRANVVSEAEVFPGVWAPGRVMSASPSTTVANALLLQSAMSLLMMA